MARLPESNKTSSRSCSICNHEKRYEIEQLILAVSPNNPKLTLEAIADSYGVSSTELRVHALMHSPLALDFSDESEASLVAGFKAKAGVTCGDEPANDGSTSGQSEGGASDSNNCNINGDNPRGVTGSLSDKVGMRESYMLFSNANEMLTTITSIGRRIKRFAGDSSDGSDSRLLAFCSPGIVNLYINSSAELRKTVETISKMNLDVNGEHDSGAEGLIALATALRGSATKSSDDTENLQAGEDEE